MTGRLRISVAEEHTCDSYWCRQGHGYLRGQHGPYKITPIRVPAPPDYSTPAEVTARCRERGTGADADILAASRNAAWCRLWKAFRALVSPTRCRVGDLHRPKWEYRYVEANGKPAHYERRPIISSGELWSVCESDEQAS